MTPEERLAELLRALPAAPDGVGRGGEGAARGTARARDALGADRARPSCCVRRRSPISRRCSARRASSRRRPSSPTCAPGSRSDLDDARRRARRRHAGRAARGARRARAGACGRLGGGAGDDDGGRARPARRACLAGLGRGAGDRSPGRRARGPRAPARGRRSPRLRARARAARRPRARRRARRGAAPRRARARSQIAETAADVAALAALAAREGADTVRGDAWAAATLAEAAATAASRLVHVNLATRPDDDMTTRAAQAQRAATAARDVALSTE